MAKLTLPDIGSLANNASARQAINDNFAAIEEAFDNTLSRDGTLPNQMEADIDLNDNDLLNVGVIDADEVRINGIPIQQEVTYGSVHYQIESGTGAQQTYILQEHPGSLGNLEVSVDGEVLRPGIDYNFEGLSLYFTTPPALGTNNILIRYAVALLQGTMDADAVLMYMPLGDEHTSVQAHLERLAGPDGAIYVGAVQTGTGATAESLQTDYRRTVYAEQFGAIGDGVTDDAAAIQLALDRAIGGRCVLTAGKTYGLTAALQIPSNTTLDATGATIKRLAGTNNMIRNKGDGVTGGYSQNFNISIIGGTWTCDDGFAATDPCTVIGFTHCTNVWIKDCNILNPTAWHHIEINGCQSVYIDKNVLQQGSVRALTTNEAIQIDANLGGGQWPWQGPADSTACTTVKITDCWFNNVGTGIGTHSGAAALIHNDIQIDGCTFFQPYYAGIHARGWSGVKVTNCRFYEGAYGVFMDMQDNNVVNDYLIQGNTFFRIGFTSFGVTSARAVYANGNSSGTQYVRNWRITNNFVGAHTNAGKSTHALTMDYCKQGVFANNTCQDINRCAIWAFGCDRVVITGNEVINANIEAVSAGIIAGGTGSVNTTRINLSGNITDTMNIASCDRTIARNNIITTAAGLSTSGNTNTTVSENLTDTTFA